MKIFNLNPAIIKIKGLKQGDKKIVLVGGCFDIIHPGHLRFLEKAKEAGDMLVVALESDKKVRILKGKDRPFFPQNERAQMLAALSVVDMVILLPMMVGGKFYAELVASIKPDVIAVTEDDPLLKRKSEQAEKYGGKVMIVIPRLKKYATSNLVNLLGLN